MAVMQRPAFLLSLLFCFVFKVYSYDGDRKEAPPDFEERFSALASRVEQLKSRDRLQQAEIRHLFVDEVTFWANLANRIRRAENEQTIAFFATKGSHAIHTGQNQNIVFETVVTNVGGAYSNTLGAFLAPVDGIYVFSVNLMAYGTQVEHYHLSKNSKQVCKLFVRAAESPNMVTSQTAILRLAQGDNVEVQTLDSDGSVHGETYSSFAGFLLQQEYNSPTVVGK